MDNKEEVKEEGKTCCATKCCSGKAIGALALLLAVGAGGFFAGRHCTKVCPVSGAPAITAPAATK